MIMWWLWILYALCLVCVVFVSNKLAQFVDALDKKTKLSGAFLGGVLLAAVTSLPELITSLTAVFLSNPNLTLGNILGSNVFNMTVFAVAILVFAKKVTTKTVSKSNVISCVFVAVIALAVMICSVADLQVVIPGININILTPLLLVLYVVALVVTSKTNGGENESEEEVGECVNARIEAMSAKQVMLWFVVCAIALVGISVGMTFIVDKLAEVYNIGGGLAGALFLGIATSLPEIVSTMSLVKYGNFDAGYGNIIGSCLFNFGIIAIADIFYFAGTVFTNDFSNMVLSISLAVSAVTLLGFTALRNSKAKVGKSLPLQIVVGIILVLSYIAYLIINTVL